MVKIVMIGSAESEIAKSLSAVPEFRLVFSDSADVLPDTACVLVLQETAGERLPEIIRMLESRGIPFAVLASDSSEQNQEKLLDAGALNIFLLPISPSLLQKRVRLLAGMNAPETRSFDLFAQIAANGEQRGAYAVQEENFVNIYRFVVRLQDRLEKKAQLITFSFHTRLNFPIEPGTLEEAFPIVQKCLRRGDIACIYGNTILCILLGADAEGGRIAAERIAATYNSHAAESFFTMRYEMQDIP